LFKLNIYLTFSFHNKLASMKLITLLLSILFSNIIYSQDSLNTELPYHQIPEYPLDYSSGNILSRMIDGLGYRYYWSTKDLREEDLNYKPSEDGKTTAETLEHLYGLSGTILNGCLNKPNIRPQPENNMDYADMRAATLRNLKQASEACLNMTAEEVQDLNIIFQRGENISSLDFWHMINGPIADAIYHAGQIVAFRRASGNPLDSGVNVFMGKTKE